LNLVKFSELSVNLWIEHYQRDSRGQVTDGWRLFTFCWRLLTGGWRD